MNSNQQEKRRNSRKVDNDFFKALDKCANAVTLTEMSRTTGIRIELLRRYLDRKVKLIRNETWDKIYPVLQPYLEAPVPPSEPPPRIGAPYRRHAELVEMLSEQKVMLDEFDIFPENKQKEIVKHFNSALPEPAQPTAYSSLSKLENAAMGAFLAMDKETRDTYLAELTAQATAEVRRRRAELF